MSIGLCYQRLYLPRSHDLYSPTRYKSRQWMLQFEPPQTRDKEMDHSVWSPLVDIFPPLSPQTTNSTAQLLSASSGSLALLSGRVVTEGGGELLGNASGAKNQENYNTVGLYKPSKFPPYVTRIAIQFRFLRLMSIVRHHSGKTQTLISYLYRSLHLMEV
jgi:hypothetical protein